MKILILEPNGWPCTLEECPPGFFVTCEEYGSLCFKSEYTMGINDHRIQAFNCAGEFFCGSPNAKSEEERIKIMVQPVIDRWEDEEG